MNLLFSVKFHHIWQNLCTLWDVTYLFLEEQNRVGRPKLTSPGSPLSLWLRGVWVLLSGLFGKSHSWKHLMYIY